MIRCLFGVLLLTTVVAAKTIGAIDTVTSYPGEQSYYFFKGVSSLLQPAFLIRFFWQADNGDGSYLAGHGLGEYVLKRMLKRRSEACCAKLFRPLILLPLILLILIRIFEGCLVHLQSQYYR